MISIWYKIWVDIPFIFLWESPGKSGIKSRNKPEWTGINPGIFAGPKPEYLPFPDALSHRRSERFCHGRCWTKWRQMTRRPRRTLGVCACRKEDYFCGADSFVRKIVCSWGMLSSFNKKEFLCFFVVIGQILSAFCRHWPNFERILNFCICNFLSLFIHTLWSFSK